jgi:hypothetical protein
VLQQEFRVSENRRCPELRGLAEYDYSATVRRLIVVPKSPWKSFAAPKSDREYRAMLSYLPLNKWRAMPRFLRYSSQIQHQLADSEGLIGYSLDANILSRKFWTLSVWEDEESLWRFVQRMPHSRVMEDLLPDMGQTKFFAFRVNGSSIPPDWEDTKRRMEER